MRLKINIISLLVLLSITFNSCKKDAPFVPLFSISDDIKLGKQVVTEIEVTNSAQYPIVDSASNVAAYQFLYGIRNEILNSGKIVYKDEFEWRIRIVKDDTTLNAFCTPGGYIYIYTGLIRFVESTDELAGIIAHEIAHGDLRHSTDQMTKVYGIQVLTTLITGGEGEVLTNLGINLLGLKFSRSDEEGADAMAIKYLNDTDFNPKAFANFFKRMDAKSATMGPLQFLSTHPNPNNRVEKIELLWKQSGAKKGKDHSKALSLLRKSLP